MNSSYIRIINNPDAIRRHSQTKLLPRNSCAVSQKKTKSSQLRKTNSYFDNSRIFQDAVEKKQNAMGRVGTSRSCDEEETDYTIFFKSKDTKS